MAYNSTVESFRDDEYPMMQGKIYLDHGGTTIYARSLIEEFSRKMVSNLYGNPHSDSDPAQLSSRVVQSTRDAALAFFGADPEHFDLIFTANATASIKLVAESFRDLALASSTTGSFFYGYHRDAHTSIVGVRELTSGTHHCFTSDQEVEDWLEGVHSASNVPNLAGLPGLFAYPGQSNMTGRRLPLSWTRKLRQSPKLYHQNTYSLLDAAALATTTQLDFSDPDAAPDFTVLSFYKIFGFPDLGALIVRRKSGHILSWRRYFGGGTVNMLTVLHEPTVQRKDATLHDALEDGTLPFHSIVALSCAIDIHKKLYGCMRIISLHTLYLARRLYLGMTSLRHFNGQPVCVIHSDSREGNPYDDPTTQGSTVAFSILRSDGTYIGHSIVEQLANDEGIYVRSGGLCNPGGIASYLKVEPWQFKRAWSAGYRCGEGGPLEIINGKPTGVVRVSLGAMSTLADVDTFLEFLAVTFETKAEVVKINEQDGLDHRREENLIRSDSGFHSRAGSTTASPPSPQVVRRISSVTSLMQMKPKPYLQQSYCGGMGKRDMGMVIHPTQVQVPGRRPCTSRDAAPIMASVRLCDEATATEDLARISREEKYEGKNGKRTRFRFWRGRRTGVRLVSVS